MLVSQVRVCVAVCAGVGLRRVFVRYFLLGGRHFLAVQVRVPVIGYACTFYGRLPVLCWLYFGPR